MSIFIKKTYILLFVILLVAGILRFWDLKNYPAGFNADEAALGYNAYSLLQTGKDEYGTAYPLAFKSFGDYKPGLYVYLDMPFVATLGLNETAVRLPSAILGWTTVLIVFLLSRKIFKNDAIALLSSLVLATAPWHIHFSRGAWESNVATFFMTLGLLLFLYGLSKRICLLLSLLLLGAAMYTYQSPRLVVPVLILLLLIFYFRKLFKLPNRSINFQFVKQFVGFNKALFVIGVITIIFAIPLILQFTSGSGEARFSGLTFLSDPGPINRTNELRGEHPSQKDILALAVHNKILTDSVAFLGHYLDHFSSTFLFINGDPLIRDKVPDVGQFYIIEALFLGLGILYLMKSGSPDAKVIWIWVLVAPVASAMTFQTPHALRALNMVVPLSIIIGSGLYFGFSLLQRKWRYLAGLIVGIIMLFEAIHYLYSYFYLYPKAYPLSWEYGFSQMVDKLNNYQNKYQNIVITDRYDQPYILVLFYKKYNPAQYQPQAHLSERDKFNFGTVRAFDNFQFRKIDPGEVNKTNTTLFIGTPEEIPQSAHIIDQVNFPNGDPAFVFAD